MNNMIWNVVVVVCVCLYGFLLGSIPNGVIIGKYFLEMTQETMVRIIRAEQIQGALSEKGWHSRNCLDILKAVLPFGAFGPFFVSREYVKTFLFGMTESSTTI